MMDVLVLILLLYVAVKDAKTMEIPDRLNAAIGILALVSIWISPETSLAERVIGACCVSVPMYVLCMLISNAFGGGDIKLTVVMGAYLGWKRMMAGMFLAILLGGMQAVCLLIRGKVKVGENAHMAFGPALCAGMAITVIWGEELLFRYFEWFC